MRRQIYLNGKFAGRNLTAVDLVASEYFKAFGRLIADPASALSRDDFTVLLRSREAASDPCVQGFKLEVLPCPNGPLWEQMLAPRAAQDGILVNLCNLGPVLHSNAVTLIHDAQVFDTPASASAAFNAYYRSVYLSIGRRHLRIVTVSEYSKGRLVANGIAPAERIVVIPNGVDHALQTPRDDRILETFGLEAGRYVVALANPKPHKNTQVLIRAFDGWSNPELRLVLFGSGSPELFGVEPGDPVIFTGRISDAQRRSLYENALCLAAPARHEGFGLAPGEAMALGCPVVLAPEGALPELGANAAVYAPADDPAAWRDAFQTLRDDPQERARRAQAGIERAGDLSWDNAARGMLDTLDQVFREQADAA